MAETNIIGKLPDEFLGGRILGYDIVRPKRRWLEALRFDVIGEPRPDHPSFLPSRQTSFKSFPILARTIVTGLPAVRYRVAHLLLSRRLVGSFSCNNVSSHTFSTGNDRI